MFIPGWAIFVILLAIISIFLWVVRLYRHIRRMRRIIWRLEAVDSHDRIEGKTGDAEGHG